MRFTTIAIVQLITFDKLDVDAYGNGWRQYFGRYWLLVTSIGWKNKSRQFFEMK